MTGDDIRMNKKFMKKVVLSLGISVMGASSLGVTSAFADTYSYKGDYTSHTKAEYEQKVKEQITKVKDYLTTYQRTFNKIFKQGWEEVIKQHKIHKIIDQYKEDLRTPKADKKSIEKKIDEEEEKYIKSDEKYQTILEVEKEIEGKIAELRKKLSYLEKALKYPDIKKD